MEALRLTTGASLAAVVRAQHRIQLAGSLRGLDGSEPYVRSISAMCPLYVRQVSALCPFRVPWVCVSPVPEPHPVPGRWLHYAYLHLLFYYV